MYQGAKEIDGVRGAGTFILCAARHIARCDVRQRQFFYEPITRYDTMLHPSLIRDKLSQAYVHHGWAPSVLASFWIFPSAYTAPLGVIQLPSPGERQLGTHAVFIPGGWTDGGERLVFQNSWGSGWGNQGCGTLSRAYIDQYLVDAWQLQRARVGPTRAKINKLNTATSAREYAGVWMLENPRWRQRFRHRGRHHQLVQYSTWSLEENCPVDITEIRNGFGLRLAWMHLYHTYPDDRRVAVLKEFFIWPTERRLGYGTLLESIASRDAQIWGADKLRIYIHNVDGWPRVRIAARRFAERNGYEWRWRQQERPLLAAVAEKDLRP